MTGATRIAAVIGTPVRHSLSPAIHNAGFAATGLDWAYGAFDVAAGRAADAVAAMRTLGLGGLSVTMPHKDGVAAAVDRLSPHARALGAANCVAWDGDELVGHNTDGDGLVDALRHDGHSVAEARCVVLGAGGAARSVCLALADAGALEVVVINRSREKAEVAAALAGSAGRIGNADDVAKGTIVINATSVGMAGTGTEGSLPCDAAALHAGQIVVDLVYHPIDTALLRAARASAATAVAGTGMLVHQAARQFGLWTGVEPPVAAMQLAVAAAIEGDQR